MHSSNLSLLHRMPRIGHMIREADSSGSETTTQNLRKFARGLNLFDSTMLVVGAMIGSGIFIVPAEMARHVGSAGWLLVAWGVAGVLTIAGASDESSCRDFAVRSFGPSQWLERRRVLHNSRAFCQGTGGA